MTTVIAVDWSGVVLGLLALAGCAALLVAADRSDDSSEGSRACCPEAIDASPGPRHAAEQVEAG